jgi:hypothetical protein
VVTLNLTIRKVDTNIINDGKKISAALLVENTSGLIAMIIRNPSAERLGKVFIPTVKGNSRSDCYPKRLFC